MTTPSTPRAQIAVMYQASNPPKPTQFLIMVSGTIVTYLDYAQVKTALATFDRMLEAREMPAHEHLCGACHADMSKQLGCAGCRADCAGMGIFMRLHATECEGCAAGEPVTMGTHRQGGKAGPTRACTAKIDDYQGAIR